MKQDKRKSFLKLDLLELNHHSTITATVYIA